MRQNLASGETTPVAVPHLDPVSCAQYTVPNNGCDVAQTVENWLHFAFWW